MTISDIEKKAQNKLEKKWKLLSFTWIVYSLSVDSSSGFPCRRCPFLMQAGTAKLWLHGRPIIVDVLIRKPRRSSPAALTHVVLIFPGWMPTPPLPHLIILQGILPSFLCTKSSRITSLIASLIMHLFMRVRLTLSIARRHSRMFSGARWLWISRSQRRRCIWCM